MADAASKEKKEMAQFVQQIVQKSMQEMDKKRSAQLEELKKELRAMKAPRAGGGGGAAEASFELDEDGDVVMKQYKSAIDHHVQRQMMSAKDKPKLKGFGRAEYVKFRAEYVAWSAARDTKLTVLLPDQQLLGWARHMGIVNTLARQVPEEVLQASDAKILKHADGFYKFRNTWDMRRVMSKVEFPRKADLREAMTDFTGQWADHSVLFPKNDEPTLVKVFTDLMPVRGVRRFLESERPPTLLDAYQTALDRAAQIDEAREIDKEDKDMRPRSEGYGSRRRYNARGVGGGRESDRNRESPRHDRAGRDQKPGQRQDIRCFKCGKKGHIRRDCKSDSKMRRVQSRRRREASRDSGDDSDDSAVTRRVTVHKTNKATQQVQREARKQKQEKRKKKRDKVEMFKTSVLLRGDQIELMDVNQLAVDAVKATAVLDSGADECVIPYEMAQELRSKGIATNIAADVKIADFANRKVPHDGRVRLVVCYADVNGVIHQEFIEPLVCYGAKELLLQAGFLVEKELIIPRVRDIDEAMAAIHEKVSPVAAPWHITPRDDLKAEIDGYDKEHEAEFGPQQVVNRMQDSTSSGVTTDDGGMCQDGEACDGPGRPPHEFIHYLKTCKHGQKPTKFSPFTQLKLKEGAELPNHLPADLSADMRQVLDTTLDELLELGFIEPSEANCCSRVVLVRKPGRKERRMCCDFRDLNRVTKPYTIPPTSFKHILDGLSRDGIPRFWSTIDLRRGYYHQRIEDEDIRDLTTFITHRGKFRWTVCCFGLRNAGQSFVQEVRKMLAGIDGVYDFVDDIILGGRTFEEHQERARQVLSRCQEYGMVINLEKCVFAAEEVKFCGHIFSAQGVRLDPERVEAIQRIAVPKTKKQLRQLLGATSFTREFVEEYKRPAAILSDMTKQPRRVLVWNDEQLQAVQDLKDAVCNAVTLAYPRNDLPYIIESDACDLAAGAVLKQRHEDGKEYPVAFMSKKFTEAQRKWPTGQQELWAILLALDKFEVYTGTSIVTVRTDHANLQSLHSAKAPRLQRWALAIQDRPITVAFIKGSTNKVADWLSRAEMDDNVAATSVRAVYVATDTREIAPENRELVKQAHCWRVGHVGVDRTLRHLELMGKRWPQQELDVKQFVRECSTCQLIAKRQALGQEERRTIRVSEPFERVDIDCVGPLEEDAEGNRYCICAIDAFTKFIELKAVPTAESVHAARFINELSCRYAKIQEFRSDRGQQFCANIVEDLLKTQRIGHTTTLGSRPQANGHVERAQYEVIRLLRAILLDTRVQRGWSEQLCFVQHIINSEVHSATGFSPKQMMYGDAVTEQRGLLQQARQERTQTTTAYVQELKATQGLIEDLARAHMDKVIEERLQDAGEATEFEAGSLVLVAPYGRRPRKLGASWAGPMRVLHQQRNNVEVEDLLSGKTKIYHVTRLRRYNCGPDVDPREVAVLHDQGMGVVDRVLGHREHPEEPGQVQIHVAWLGFELDGEETTFEDLDKVQHLDIVKDYCEQHGLRMQ